MPEPRQKSRYQDTVCLFIDHAAVTADTVKFFKNHTGRKLRIDKIHYNNPTGLAADASNYFAVQVKNGATVVGAWSTLTGAQGALVAGTTVDLVLNTTDANLVLAAGDELTLNLDETGTSTLPAGRVQVWATLL
jgi:hypothetical protein